MFRTTITSSIRPFTSLFLAVMCKHDPQNRKYITYRNATRGGPSHHSHR